MKRAAGYAYAQMIGDTLATLVIAVWALDWLGAWLERTDIPFAFLTEDERTYTATPPTVHDERTKTVTVPTFEDQHGPAIVVHESAVKDPLVARCDAAAQDFDVQSADDAIAVCTIAITAQEELHTKTITALAAAIAKEPRWTRPGWYLVGQDSVLGNFIDSAPFDSANSCRKNIKAADTLRRCIHLLSEPNCKSPDWADYCDASGWGPEELTNQTASQNPIEAALAYALRCAALTSKGRLDDAERDCAKSLAIEPEFGTAYVSRGRLRFQRQQFQEAIADFDHAIAAGVRNETESDQLRSLRAKATSRWYELLARPEDEPLNADATSPDGGTPLDSDGSAPP